MSHPPFPVPGPEVDTAYRQTSDGLYPGKAADYFDVVRTDALERLPRRLGDVLDVGGGNGATAKYLVDSGQADSATIVDPFCSAADTDTMTFLRRSAEDESVFANLAERDGGFDTILFLDVLEHLHDPWRTLRLVRPLLRPGGLLLVSVPNARFVALTVPLVLFGRFEYKASGVMDNTHIRWFTRPSAIRLVSQAGFEIETVVAKVDHRVTLLNLATLGIFRRFLEKQYFVSATT